MVKYMERSRHTLQDINLLRLRWNTSMLDCFIDLFNKVILKGCQCLCCFRWKSERSWRRASRLMKMSDNCFTQTSSVSNHERAVSVSAVDGLKQTGNIKINRSNRPCPWYMRHNRRAAYGTWVEPYICKMVNGTFGGISRVRSVAWRYEELSPEKSSHKVCASPVALSSSNLRSLLITSNSSGDTKKAFSLSATVFTRATEAHFSYDRVRQVPFVLKIMEGL